MIPILSQLCNTQSFHFTEKKLHQEFNLNYEKLLSYHEKQKIHNLNAGWVMYRLWKYSGCIHERIHMITVLVKQKVNYNHHRQLSQH